MDCGPATEGWQAHDYSLSQSLSVNKKKDPGF